MGFLVWLVLVNLLPLAAVVLLFVPRALLAKPWLGLATAVVATNLALSSSATLVERESIGAGIGWVATALYGLIGLVIVLGYLRFRPVPFISIASIIAGIVFIASFYAFLPPFIIEPSDASMLVFALSGVVFIVYGATLWRRHGLNNSTKSGQSASQPLELQTSVQTGHQSEPTSFGFSSNRCNRRTAPPLTRCAPSQHVSSPQRPRLPIDLLNALARRHPFA